MRTWPTLLALLGSACSGPEHLPEARAAESPLVSLTDAGHQGEDRYFANGVVLADGRVLLIGGREGGGAGSSATTFFEPLTARSYPGPPMRRARTLHVAVRLFDGRVFVAGGTNQYQPPELFDPTLSLWTLLAAPMPDRDDFTATLRSDGRVVMLGGRGTSTWDLVDVFDPATDTVYDAGTLGVGRSAHGALAGQGSSLLVLGGLSPAPRLSLGSVELISGSGVSSPYGQLPVPVHSAGSLVEPGVLALVLGGQTAATDGGVAQTAVQVIPLDGGAITLASQPLLSRRSDAMVARLPNGEAALIGGDDNGALATYELYPSGVTGVLPNATRYGTVVVMPTGQVLVAGGQSTTGFLWVFEARNEAVAACPPLPSPRQGGQAVTLPTSEVLVVGGGSTASALYTDGGWVQLSGVDRPGATATLLEDGTVLVTGGREADGGTSSAAATYDPASRTFSPAGPLSQARTAHTATRLVDGTVLVVGGTGPTGALLSVERYEPGTRSFSNASALPQARSGHAAALLPDGGLIVTGGNDGVTAYTMPLLLLDPMALWQALPPAPTGRTRHATVVLPDERVLVLGGVDGTGRPISSVEALTGSSWSSLSPMPFSSDAGVWAVPLRSGQLFVAGRSPSRFDPRDGLWRPLDAGTYASPGTGAALFDDSVLLVGESAAPSTKASRYLEGLVNRPRPNLAPVVGPALVGQTLTLGGTRFLDFGGAEGQAQASASNLAVLHLEPLEGGFGRYVPVRVLSPTQLSVTFPSVRPGYYLVRVISSGVPSVAQPVRFGFPVGASCVRGSSCAGGCCQAGSCAFCPDAGTADAGVPDAGTLDGGPSDGGEPDGGPSDGGAPDGGPSDAGAPDGGPSDGGEDGGDGGGGPPTPHQLDLAVGCDCGSGAALTPLAFALWTLRRATGKRRRPGR